MAYIVFVYLLGLHASIAVMEMSSWLLVAIELGRRIRYRERPWFPTWIPMAGLTLCVFIGLCINPEGRTFLEQIGFMRWIILMYFFAWILYHIWSEKFERRLMWWWAALV